MTQREEDRAALLTLVSLYLMSASAGRGAEMRTGDARTRMKRGIPAEIWDNLPNNLGGITDGVIRKPT